MCLMESVIKSKCTNKTKNKNKIELHCLIIKVVEFYFAFGLWWRVIRLYCHVIGNKNNSNIDGHICNKKIKKKKCIINTI